MPTESRHYQTDIQYPGGPTGSDRPATSLPFLGISLDVVAMEAKLFHEKLQRLQLLVTKGLDKYKTILCDILSLVDQFQCTTRVTRQGRTTSLLLSE